MSMMMMMLLLTGLLLIMQTYLAESMPHPSDTTATLPSLYLDEPWGAAAGECVDKSSSCHKIGRKLHLSRCYDVRQYTRCCATCTRLRLPLTDCQFGDKELFCSSIGKEQPASDCYSHNKTCCQTCHIYDSGIPGCPFGDRVGWCSDIGNLYDTRSCYDHEIHCCDTCRQYRTGITGCPYGDRLTWCPGIGTIFPLSFCASHRSECCQTCHTLRLQGHTFDKDKDVTSTVSVTRNTQTISRDIITTTTPRHDTVTSSSLQLRHTNASTLVDQSTPPTAAVTRHTPSHHNTDTPKQHKLQLSDNQTSSVSNNNHTIPTPWQPLVSVTKSFIIVANDTSASISSSNSSSSGSAVTGTDSVSSFTTTKANNALQSEQTQTQAMNASHSNSNPNNISGILPQLNDALNITVNTTVDSNINDISDDRTHTLGTIVPGDTRPAHGTASEQLVTVSNRTVHHSSSSSQSVLAGAAVTSPYSGADIDDLNQRQQQNSSNSRDNHHPGQATNAISSDSHSFKSSRYSLQITVCYLIYLLSINLFPINSHSTRAHLSADGS